MTQRRIVMFNQVSADGFFSDPQGGLDWVIQDPEIQGRAVAGMPQCDTVLFGRKTYQQFASFWPTALKDMDTEGPHGGSKKDPSFSAMAHWLNDAKKLVFSKSLRTAPWNNSEIFAELDPKEIAALKKKPGKDALVFGSGSLVSQLSEHGLIDEYRFVVSPLLLGSGKTLLGDLSKRVSLKLAESQPFSSGCVMLTYTLAGK